MKIQYTHACTTCGQDTVRYSTQHHNDGAEYIWVCNTCGVETKHVFTNGGKTVSQKPTGRRCERTRALFQLNDCPKITFIYEGVAWEGNLDHDYYYHEGTCPTNLLRCEEILVEGQPDQHGMFTCIKEILVTGPNGMDVDAAEEELKQLAVFMAEIS